MKKDQMPSILSRRGFIRQAACAALGTKALTEAIGGLRFINAAAAQSVATDYKALVCIFLSGGNDSNNLIIPTIASEHADYAAIRGDILSIPISGAPFVATPVSPINSDGHEYGLHPACPELATLFGEGKLAMIFNTGTLLYPLTRADYRSGRLQKPPQLFSHSDQVTQWQTSLPDRPPLTGWGGRCADLLAAVQPGAPISMAISLSGANTFEVGNITSQYSVTTSGAIGLNSVSGARLQSLTNLLALPYPNLQARAYANVGEHAIQTGGLLNEAIFRTNDVQSATNPTPWVWRTPFPPRLTSPTGGNQFSSGLVSQLKMVARLIEAGSRSVANGGFGMKRQIFFCQVGGYDTHSGQTQGANNPTAGSHANLLAELSQGMNAFQRAMEQLELSNNVTSFTSSDFGRTFPANGDGTDHGWGGHHIVMGGAVNGRRTYGSFPTLAVNGPDDTSTGRWIPSIATDQYFATLASWFGVDNGNLSTVFPNLGRFSTANLGFV